MQKPALIILLFIGCASNIQAQNLELINQLRTELKGAQGESRFKTLNAIGWEYRFSSPDSTIWYANQAYQLGVELKLKRDLARSLNYMGIANNYKGGETLVTHYVVEMTGFDATARAVKIAGGLIDKANADASAAAIKKGQQQKPEF